MIDHAYFWCVNKASVSTKNLTAKEILSESVSLSFHYHSHLITFRHRISLLNKLRILPLLLVIEPSVPGTPTPTGILIRLILDLALVLDIMPRVPSRLKLILGLEILSRADTASTARMRHASHSPGNPSAPHRALNLA